MHLCEEVGGQLGDEELASLLGGLAHHGLIDAAVALLDRLLLLRQRLHRAAHLPPTNNSTPLQYTLGLGAALVYA